MYLFYAMAKIYKKRFSSIITVIMLSIGISVLAYAFSTYYLFNYSKMISRSVISGDYKMIYHIDFGTYALGGEKEADNIRDFYKWLSKRNEIKNLGTYFIFNEERKIYITGTICEICGIELPNEDNKTCCWAGRVYNGVYQKGKAIHDEITDRDYIFNGFVEQESFLGDDFFSGNGELIKLSGYTIFDADELINEQSVFFLNGAVNNMYFLLSEGVDEEFIDLIKNRAKQVGIDTLYVHNLVELFRNLENKAAEEMGEKYLMPAIIMLCSLFAMVIVSLESYLLDIHDTGIMIANGITKIETMAIYLFENVIKYFVADVMFLLYWFYTMPDIQSKQGDSMIKAVPVVLEISFIMSLVTSIPVILKVIKTQVIKAIGAQE